MRLGLFGVNMGPCATPEGAVRVASLAERLGYDSLWLGEHVVAPRPRVRPSPMEPDYPILDPIVALAHLAATTERARLATGIVILPQRNPVVLAKQVASLDVLSRGRLLLGIGVGYLEPEMRAVGVPMEGRGRRADEYLRAMRCLWEDEPPAFRGSQVELEGVDAYPRPVQRPLPVVVAGHSRAAHRRAARHGEGWYGFGLDRSSTAEQVASLHREEEAAGRPRGPLEITVSPSEPLNAAVVHEYAELGVDRLAILPPRSFWRDARLPLAEVEEFLHANSPAELGVAG